ncbi:MAG TPA: hypothetical protein PK820_00310 [Candidatus Competibacteraceae bacterium]|mgnify:FL=1|nr:hypothetical protein [Candidatus Competibacteraceae bacterium]
MSTHDDPLNDALEVIRERFQGTQNELAALLNACATHGQRADEMVAAIDAIRQEVQETQKELTALRESSGTYGERIDTFGVTMETFRQEMQESLGGLGTLHQTSATHSQQVAGLAAALDTVSQKLEKNQDDLVSVRDVNGAYGQQIDKLTVMVDTVHREVHDALRQEIQKTQSDLAALREANHAGHLRSDELAGAMDALRQELQGVRQVSVDLEKALRTQSMKHREQLDAHTRELAALTERSRTQTQEINGHIDALTSLHKQEHAQRETALATLSKLNERVSILEQQFNEERARGAEALGADRERLAALEKWLGAQAEQFGKFDPILRELHGQMVALHERLTALEGIESASFLDDHEQRLGETERQIQEQTHAFEEMQQTVEQLALRWPATARLNKILIGGLISAGVAIIVLLVLLNTG